MVKYQVPMGLRDAAHRRRGGEKKKNLVLLILPWKGSTKSFTKIEVHAGMAEQLVKDFVIEEALRTEIKETLEHKNLSHFDLCALSDKEKRRTRLNLPLHMKWDDRRDHLVRYITPIAGMPSLLV